MYQPDAELLFPARVIPTLEGLRGERWDELVNSVCAHPEGSLDWLGFSLMMIRLDGCMTCHAGSHRARLGCTVCAQQATRRYKGSDDDLTAEFLQACDDVQAYLRRTGKKKAKWAARSAQLKVKRHEF
jgi:formate dehydrogenase maturation protein FdhE